MAARRRRPQRRPLSFFSKKLDAAQLKYSAFHRELLAAYLSLRHFRYMLDGRKFHILSDHKPLTQALHRVSDPWTPRVQRQLSFLTELTSDMSLARPTWWRTPSAARLPRRWPV